MKLVCDPRLTNPFPHEIAASIAHTFVGMAHFAGTGPDGRTCRECAAWCKGAKKFAREKMADGGGFFLVAAAPSRG